MGAIIGSVELHDIVTFDTSLEAILYASGPFCYLLKNLKWFGKPIPCQGQLGIFKLPEALVSPVEKQLKESGRKTQVSEELLNEIRPSKKDSCLHQGVSYLEMGLKDDALRCLNEEIKLDKSNATGYCWRSIVHAALDNSENLSRTFPKLLGSTARMLSSIIGEGISTDF